MHGNSDIVNSVDFLHNSPRRHHLAQARMVSSSKYALWTVFTQVGNYSPRRESSSLKRGYSRPGEEVCSLECFRLGEKSFAQAMRYSSLGESIFAQAKINLVLWTTFAQAINFRLGEGYFRSGEISLAQAKKNFFFFLAFCF